MDNERILIALGEIKEEIGGLRADARNSDRRFDELKKLLTDSQERINKLEHSHTRMKTYAGLLSAAVSAVFTLGLAYLKGS